MLKDKRMKKNKRMKKYKEGYSIWNLKYYRYKKIYNEHF